jgi:large subunit ribosomal protein L28
MYISFVIFIAGNLEAQMSKVCDICGKGPVSGNSVSHAHNVNRRMFKPNLRNIKLDVDGVKKSVKCCMKCLKTLSKV